MTAKVIGFRGKRASRVRPLTKTYHPDAPYVVERRDEENGDICYDVID